MVILASGLGGGNSIFRSIRPGLSKAESRMSIRLVAMMTYHISLNTSPAGSQKRKLTLMFLVGSNPSN